MKSAKIISVAIFLLGVASPTLAQEGSIGEQEYRSSCAVCHGISGNGDGPFAEFIKHGTPPLTTLTKDNGGVFPFDRVYRTIDGRLGAKGHGTTEMPVWGDTFKARTVAEYGPFFGEFYSEDRVRARILSLIDHINSLQAK